MAIFSALPRVFLAWTITKFVTGIAWHALFVTEEFKEFIRIVLDNWWLWTFTSPMMCEFAFGVLSAMAITYYGPNYVLRTHRTSLLSGANHPWIGSDRWKFNHCF